MTVSINATAARIVTTLRTKTPDVPALLDLGWDAMRDLCDIATGGDLDGQPLDLLTDAVWKRLGGPAQ